MSQTNDIKWSGSPPDSPVLLQRAESRCDVIDEVVPQPSGGVPALFDGLSPELSRRPGRTRHLVLLTRRRHLLAFTRRLVVQQMSLMGHLTGVCELLERSPPSPSILSSVCLRLRDLTAHRLGGDPYLYPISSMEDPARTIPGTLLLMAIKAALLTERLVLLVLRRAARVPGEVTTDLILSLTAYNQVVTHLAKPAGPSNELRPFPLSRTLEVLAEERGRMMAEELCRVWSHRGLETLINPPTDPSKSHAIPGQRSPGSLGVLVQDRSQVVPGQRSPGSLGVLVQEDRSHVTPVLQILIGLEKKMWTRVRSGSDPALYSQYCSCLWPALYAHVFHALCPGRRGPRGLPALPSLPEGAWLSAIHILQDTLISEDLPEPCASLGHSLCQRLLCVRSLNAWDSTLCRALSSAQTDKCTPSMLIGGDPVSGSHSRTAGILVTLCRRLSELLDPASPAHQSPQPWSLGDSSPPWCDLLSRSSLSLHLCDMWLQRRSQTFLSSGSLRQLVIITHGDLPVMKAPCRSLVAAAENVTRLPSIQTSLLRIKRSREVLEGLAVSLPHVLSSVCSRMAQDLFLHTMPAGRHWKGKLVTGPDPAPSEYAQAALSAVVIPVLDGVMSMCLEERGAAVCAVIAVFMEAWMGHILREKIKFSLQGALQLRRDFEGVREELRSRESSLSPEVIQAALALPVFSQADNAIMCLLQQPSRKTYLQSGSCVVFSCCPHLCRVAVDTMSDSLQSLDSLERRVWDGEISGRVPRHSHDSYLPHHQRQWLSLRVHKTWNGLSLPWEDRGVSEG